MTIIAIDFTHIAADGLCLDGTLIRGLTHKKIRVDRERGLITAMAGTAGMHDAVHDWAIRGAELAFAPKCHGDTSWTMLLIDQKGLRLYTSICPYGEDERAPYAVGTDRDMAFGIMLARDQLGHAAGSARAAVELVSQHTNRAGGEIQVVDIAEVTGFTLGKLVPKLDRADGGVDEAIRQFGGRARDPWI